MLYVYKNFERPSNATGVVIELSVVDANGNYRTIGTTTSDADGFFNTTGNPTSTDPIRYMHHLLEAKLTGLHTT